jgi:multiple sugar transport system ATP-binding protein
MANLTISGVEKSFGRKKALSGIDLTVQDGEFCVVVGPSGSGKTTLLRAIAGLEDVDAGTVSFDGEVVNDLKPRDRNVAMVFQRPVLFPHLTVYANIAFGLRARSMSRAEMIPRVERVADALGISHLFSRYPRHLSEGECQSVAIAHAVVRDALAFLFDEPLARLDTVQREATRAALKLLHQEKPMTAIYVTQDQMEALNLADRVVLLRDGRVEQDGAPIDLFERPASRFVAGFFGPLKMNFLAGTVVRSEGRDAILLASGAVSVPLPPGRLPKNAADGSKVILGLRPEHMMRAVRVSPSDGTLRYEAEIELIQPTGSRVRATFRMGGEAVVAELQAHDVSAPGEKVSIDINLKRATFFDAETEKALSRIGAGATQKAPEAAASKPPPTAEPAKPVEPAEQAKQAEPVEPVETAELAESVEPTEATQPQEAAEPAESTKA